jgi:hypothetical protein
VALPVQRDEPPAELVVLRDQVAEPARDSVADDLVDEAQARIDPSTFLDDCCPA